MPKAGQCWDPGLLDRSELLSRFREVAPELLSCSEWPSLALYSKCAESRRRELASEYPPLAFVAPQPKRQRAPRTEPIELRKLYDGRIALESQVPCLAECFHDLFNVLVFSAFPRSKRVLHARQYRALTQWIPAGATRLPGRRTREQDALTVFDEGGSVVLLTSAGHAAWQSALRAGETRVELPGAACVLFGHALMEHVLHGLPTVRSSALVLVTDEDRDGLRLFDWLDEQIATRLADPGQFQAPGADAVVTIAPNGALVLSRD
jgi:Protein of unknown function (DUF3025)